MSQVTLGERPWTVRGNQQHATSSQTPRPEVWARNRLAVMLHCSSLHPMPLVQFPQFLITACKISKPLVGLQETSGKADLSCINISTFWNRSLHVCIWKPWCTVYKWTNPVNLELNKQRNVCRPLWKEQVFSADCGTMVNGRMNSTISAVMVVRLCKTISKRKSSIIEQ